MDNETVQLFAIIADVAQSQFRYIENPDRVDPTTFGRIVAQEVIQRLNLANIVVVSRWRQP